MEITEKQYQDVLVELCESMDESDAKIKARAIFDILGIDYNDIEDI